MECPQCKNPLSVENASVCEWCGNQLPIPEESFFAKFKRLYSNFIDKLITNKKRLFIIIFSIILIILLFLILRNNWKHWFTDKEPIKNDKTNALDKNLLADTVVIDKASFKLAKESVECRYFGRGHTNGDIVVHFENANIAHLGDLVFNRRFPFIDVPGGASIDQWIETLEKIVKYYDKDTIFICGHANEKYPVQINKSDIRAMQNYLDKLRIYIKQQVKDGLTEEAVIAKTTIIPGAEEWTGDGVVRSIKAGFAEYKTM